MSIVSIKCCIPFLLQHCNVILFYIAFLLSEINNYLLSDFLQCLWSFLYCLLMSLVIFFSAAYLVFFLDILLLLVDNLILLCFFFAHVPCCYYLVSLLLSHIFLIPDWFIQFCFPSFSVVYFCYSQLCFVFSCETFLVPFIVCYKCVKFLLHFYVFLIHIHSITDL